MRWSQLKARAEERFAPDVRGRVQLRVTRYRQAHDAQGRWAIEIDGREVAGLGDLVAFSEMHERAVELGPPVRSCAEARSEQEAIAHHELSRFKDAVATYLNLPFDEALTSTDAVQRALAFLDARLGRRRLEALWQHGMHDRTPLEIACLELRRERRHG